MDGLSLKVLEKLCENIISSEKELPIKQDEDIATKVNRRHILSPSLPESLSVNEN